MSFDVFFQGFRHGNVGPGGGDAMRAVIAPHIMREKTTRSFALVAYGDDTADVYLSDDHMVANRVTGEGPWDSARPGDEGGPVDGHAGGLPPMPHGGVTAASPARGVR